MEQIHTLIHRKPTKFLKDLYYLGMKGTETVQKEKRYLAPQLFKGRKQAKIMNHVLWKRKENLVEQRVQWTKPRGVENDFQGVGPSPTQ